MGAAVQSVAVGVGGLVVAFYVLGRHLHKVAEVKAAATVHAAGAAVDTAARTAAATAAAAVVHLTSAPGSSTGPSAGKPYETSAADYQPKP
jgi:hypothetical protein